MTKQTKPSALAIEFAGEEHWRAPWIHSTLAPILAAKDERIAALEGALRGLACRCGQEGVGSAWAPLADARALLAEGGAK